MITPPPPFRVIAAAHDASRAPSAVDVFAYASLLGYYDAAAAIDDAIRAIDCLLRCHAEEPTCRRDMLLMLLMITTPLCCCCHATLYGHIVTASLFTRDIEMSLCYAMLPLSLITPPYATLYALLPRRYYACASACRLMPDTFDAIACLFTPFDFFADVAAAMLLLMKRHAGCWQVH